MPIQRGYWAAPGKVTYERLVQEVRRMSVAPTGPDYVTTVKELILKHTWRPEDVDSEPEWVTQSRNLKSADVFRQLCRQWRTFTYHRCPEGHIC